MNLVTGANGLLGSYFVLELLKKGERVRAIKRANSNIFHAELFFKNELGDEFENLKSNLEWLDANLDDIFSLLDVLSGVSTVYHCAAVVGFNKMDRELLFSTNVTGTKNLVDAIILTEERPTLCHISSTAAIGHTDFGLANEECIFSQDDPHSYYGYTKYLAELEVERGRVEGLKACIVNPCVILGYTNSKRGSGKLFSQGYNGFPFYTSGSNHIVYARDVCRASFELLENSLFVGRYLCVGPNLTFRDLQTKIAKSFGNKGPSIGIPNRLMLIVGELCEFLATIRVNTGLGKELARSSTSIAEFDAGKLVAAVNFEYTALHGFIKDIAELYVKSFKKRKGLN